MLKLGKLITDTTTSAEIFNFDMSVMARTGRPTTVDFSIEPEPFGTGGFRKAFKATSNDRGFNGSTWVIHEEVSRKGCGRHHCFTSEGHSANISTTTVSGKRLI